MKNKLITKMDIFFIFLILFLSVIVKWSAFFSPNIAGDNVTFTALGQNLANGLGYTINDSLHLHWPPLFPLIIAFFDIFLDNPVISIKLVSFLFSSLTLIIVYLFCRKLALTSKSSLLATLLVLFNPFFLYFAGGILPLSESLAVFLLVFAFFIYYFYKNNHLILSGVFFGLVLMTRYNFIGFILPFLGIHFYYLIKKRHIKENLLFIIVIFMPAFLWIIRNKFISAKFVGSEYLRFFSIEHLMDIPSLAMVYGCGFFLLFLFLVPLIITSVIYFLKKKNTFWIMIISSSIFILIIMILLNPYYVSDFLFFSISRTRYLTGLVPIFTIMIFLAIKSIKKNFIKYIRFYLFLILIAFIVFSLLLTNGFIQYKLNDFFKTPNTFIKRSYYRAEAINWANYNLPKESKLLVYFNEDKYGLVGVEIFSKYYFNSNFQVLPLLETGTNCPVLFKNIVSFQDLNYYNFSHSDIYILSDDTLNNLKSFLIKDDVDVNLLYFEEIYNLPKNPVKIYLITNNLSVKDS